MCTFAIKKQKRKYELICVSLFNSVNSSCMYNIETTPKMAIILKIVLTTIMIKAFNYIHMSSLINLQNPLLIFKNQYCSLSRKQKCQKRSHRKFAFCRTKVEVKNTNFQLLQSQS